MAEKGATAPGASPGEGTEGAGEEVLGSEKPSQPWIPHPTHQTPVPHPEELLSFQHLAKNPLILINSL